MESPGRVSMRAMAPTDWPAVREIYREGIASGDATFETAPPSWESWDAARSPECRLMAEVDGAPVAFAVLSPVSKRAVYRGVREVMLYVAASARGRGVGSALLERLVAQSEAAGVWTLEAKIFPENEVSVRVFGAAGFRVVGVRRRLGRASDGRWRDVLLMERRSQVAG